MKMINKDIRNITLFGLGLTVLSAAVCLFIEPWCALVCFIAGTAVTVIYLLNTKRRYKMLSELNNYLSLVCSGKYDLDIADNAEGELSILKNNLYKVIILLRSQNEALSKDKVYLADSLADISHQLKTPLTSMMVMTDLLRGEKDEEKRRELISITETQLDKMKWLILNLLKLSKLDAGTADFKNETVSISVIAEKSLKPFLVTMDLKDISLYNNVSNFKFKGDESWTIEAVENIIKNCIEHTGKGGALTLSSKSTNLYDALIIGDDGCGIDAEDLPHIFERFYHGKNSSGDSVGIGLALSKSIVEREKGTITVTSKKGAGTTFEIRFYKAIV